MYKEVSIMNNETKQDGWAREKSRVSTKQVMDGA
jgi:hypothetical protein